MDNEFYVYIYLDPRKSGHYTYSELGFSLLFEPIYCGKGCKYRYREHLWEAKNTNKNTPKLQKIRKIIRETGKEPLVIKIKEHLSEEEAFIFEVKYIKIIGRFPNGSLTNLSDGGEGPTGMIHSKKSKDKMSRNRIGKTVGEKNPMYGKHHTQGAIEKIINALTGKKQSEESNRKRSEKLKGRKFSEVTRKKISIAISGENHPMYGKRGKDNPNYGRKHSPKSIEKIRQWHLGRPTWNKGKKTGPLTKEHREKISEALTGEKHPMYGKQHSPESIEKMRNSKLGKKASEETRNKQSESKMGEKNSFYGRKHSPESIEKMRETKRKNREKKKGILSKDPL